MTEHLLGLYRLKEVLLRIQILGFYKGRARVLLEEENKIMLKNRIKIQIKKHGTIWIRSEEIEVFEQIWTHRTMQAKSIHNLYQELSQTLRNSNAISNRLTKLVELDFLIRITKDVSVTRARVPRYYYRLGKRGLRLLAAQNRIVLDAWTRKEYQVFKHGPIPSNHTDAISILATRIYLKCRSEIPHLNQRKGISIHPLLSTKETKIIKEEGVEPDWIFQVDNRLLCIELDTGFQEHAAIRKKFGGYVRLQQKLQKEGFQLTLLFAVLDSSIDVVQKNKPKNRNSRVEKLNNLYRDYIATPLPSLLGRVEYQDLKRVYALPCAEATFFCRNLLKLPDWSEDLELHRLKRLIETE